VPPSSSPTTPEQPTRASNSDDEMKRECLKGVTVRWQRSFRPHCEAVEHGLISLVANGLASPRHTRNRRLQREVKWHTQVSVPRDEPSVPRTVSVARSRCAHLEWHERLCQTRRNVRLGAAGRSGERRAPRA
jgi:hypothetical protein